MSEEWRPIDWLDGWAMPCGQVRYEVSSLGRVRSYSARGRRMVTPRVLKPNMNSGYPRVTLMLKNRYRSKYIHRLVARAFHGTPPTPNSVVRHLNDVKSDARASNLAWGSNEDNAEDAYQNGRVATILSPITARAIARSRGPAKCLAFMYGVAPGTVHNIWNGRAWRRHVSDMDREIGRSFR